MPDANFNISAFLDGIYVESHALAFRAWHRKKKY